MSIPVYAIGHQLCLLLQLIVLVKGELKRIFTNHRLDHGIVMTVTGVFDKELNCEAGVGPREFRYLREVALYSVRLTRVHTDATSCQDLELIELKQDFGVGLMD